MIAISAYGDLGEQIAPFEGIGRYSGRPKKYEERDLHGRRGAKNNLTNHSTLVRLYHTQGRQFKEMLKELLLSEEVAIVEED